MCDLEKLADICREQVVVSTVDDIKRCLLHLGEARHVFPQLCTLVTLYYVLPASSASAERSFSALRRLKTYLRNTMTATRLNSCAVAHTHKPKTLALNPTDILREFSMANDTRRELFGKV